MALTCSFGLHKWDGCKCTGCGKFRDEAHKWDGCKCGGCGKLRDESHKWDGCKCPSCGHVRDEGHVWKGCKCAACGQVRNEGHRWKDCEKCADCGQVRNNGHDWSKDCERCAHCGKRRYDPPHKWDGCKCAACGEVRNEAHRWEGCKCATCGQVRNEAHQWDACHCRVCGLVQHEGNDSYHDWSQDENQCARCGCLSLRATRGKLLPLMMHGKGSERYGAISKIAKLRDPFFIPHLKQRLEHDSDGMVIQGAAMALGEIGTTDAAEALISYLEEVFPKFMLVEKSGHYRSEAEALVHIDQALRIGTAAEALGHTKHPRVSSVLLAVSESNNDTVSRGVFSGRYAYDPMW